MHTGRGGFFVAFHMRSVSSAAGIGTELKYDRILRIVETDGRIGGGNADG